MDGVNDVRAHEGEAAETPANIIFVTLLTKKTQAGTAFLLRTLLGVPSRVRFCQQEFGDFPRPAWAVGSYSSGPPAGGTPQILVDKTSCITGRLRV